MTILNIEQIPNLILKLARKQLNNPELQVVRLMLSPRQINQLPIILVSLEFRKFCHLPDLMHETRPKDQFHVLDGSVLADYHVQLFAIIQQKQRVGFETLRSGLDVLQTGLARVLAGGQDLVGTRVQALAHLLH